MAGKEKMKASEYKENRTRIEPEAKEYKETRAMMRENVRQLRDDVMGRAMNPLDSIRDAVMRMRGEGMKTGGKVKETKKMAVGGRPPVPMMQRPRRGEEARKMSRAQAPQRPKGIKPGAQKTRNMPRPKPAGSAKVQELMARRQAKSKKMPRPGSMVSNNAAGLISNSGPRRPSKTKQMPRPMGRKAGGDVYTTPGAPTRGKSGKPMKKYAKGGMIPSAGKKSPSSMGTPYRAGGCVTPKKYSGGGGIDGCAVKGKTRAKRGM